MSERPPARRPSQDARGLDAATPRGEPITVDLDGHPVRAFAGEPLAVALWADDVRVLGRSPKYHRPRGAFCFAGHCGSCLMRIDGQPNVRACQVIAAAGLRCERQNAFPDAEVDLLRAADWLFPRGMDHHHMMTGTRVGNALFKKLVREMGGSGTLPDEPATPGTTREESVDVCIVGAGPAGLSAAAAIAHARPQARVLVVDEHDEPGGSLLCEPGGWALAQALARTAGEACARSQLNATALAYYPEDAVAGGAPGLLAVATREGLLKIAAKRFVYATGAYDQNLAFIDNDRPDVIAARACGRLALRWGVRPARKMLLVEDAALPWDYGDRLCEALRERGLRVERRAITATDRPALRGGIVVAAALPAPASELPRQHGATVTLDPARGGFAVTVDASFATSVPGVYAVGDVTGVCGPRTAMKDGGAAGTAVAATL